MGDGRKSSEHDEGLRAFSRPLEQAALRAAQSGLDLLEVASPEEMRAVAQDFGLAELQRFEYTARLSPFGSGGWRLEGEMRAAGAQRCVVTLQPVAFEFSTPFLRLWTADAPGFEPRSAEEGGAEMAGGRLDVFAEALEPLGEGAWRWSPNTDGDDRESDLRDEIERTPDPIDPAAVALETLTLALDPYPRRAGASFDGFVVGPEGAAPLTDEAARPFAALDALKARMTASGAPAEGGADGGAAGAEAEEPTSESDQKADRSGKT
ncbi:MAG: hypothetical protein AAF909_12040 [Pseudomonadota bacterium]